MSQYVLRHTSRSLRIRPSPSLPTALYDAADETVRIRIVVYCELGDKRVRLGRDQRRGQGERCGRRRTEDVRWRDQCAVDACIVIPDTVEVYQPSYVPPIVLPCTEGQVNMAEGATYPHVSRGINTDTHVTLLTVLVSSYDMR
ncbi:hypothetical protein JG688_00018382 [Phytophthora aleatoria]|uniref:Uncharacterized protein n=1 Tax=Phytophthora aleatoria TaxID=2496075 RepID=A0A8J5IRG3_9STRA|nr:hypothetical protein JG688_00018382 [Phytophthora aleatoria]